MLGGGKAHQVWNRPRRMIENRMQEAMIDRDVSLGGCFQQRVYRNILVSFRIENQIGAQRGTTLLLSLRERRFRLSRHDATGAEL